MFLMDCGLDCEIDAQYLESIEEGPLSEGSDRGKIENGGCASLVRVSSRSR